MPKLSSCWDSDSQDRPASPLWPPDGVWSFHYLSTTVWGDVFLCQECKNSPVGSVKSVRDLSVQGTMLLRTVHVYKYFFINPCLTFKRWGSLLIISLQAVPKGVLHTREMTIAAGDPHIHAGARSVPPSVQLIILCLSLFVDRPTRSTLDLGETVNTLENSTLGNTIHTVYLWFIDYSGSAKRVYIKTRRWLLKCISTVVNLLWIKNLQLEWLTLPALIIMSST